VAFLLRVMPLSSAFLLILTIMVGDLSMVKELLIGIHI